MSSQSLTKCCDAPKLLTIQLLGSDYDTSELISFVLMLIHPTQVLGYSFIFLNRPVCLMEILYHRIKLRR
jgi:hypothetical protein